MTIKDQLISLTKSKVIVVDKKGVEHTGQLLRQSIKDYNGMHPTNSWVINGRMFSHFMVNEIIPVHYGKVSAYIYL